MTFQPKRRFSHMFNRNQKIRKNRSNQHSSKENLLSNTLKKSERFDSWKLKRSASHKRHLNTDGSSCDQLREICEKLPKEAIIKTPSNMACPKEKVNEENSTDGNVDSTAGSQQTLKSDGSSGKELQMILEKILLEENQNKLVEIFPQNGMQEKKIGNCYETRTPPLQSSRGSSNSRSPGSPIKQPMQQQEALTPNSCNKFRFEMVDPNEQTRLYLSSRKRSKKKKRRNKQQSNQRNNSLMQNGDRISGLEVKSNSVISMSSCSIDSALDDRAKRRYHHLAPPPPPRKPKRRNDDDFDVLSCKAFEFADEIKTALATWLGTCTLFPEDDEIIR